MKKSLSLPVLTIDQGNSSAKIAVWNDNLKTDSVRLFSMTIEDLLPILETSGADSCVYCSVGHTDAKFIETLRRIFDGRLLVVTPSTPLPVRIEYGSRATLGNDRVAAAAGAAEIFKGRGCLVVDAGTAVTLDVVTADGTFTGGNIAPGLRLRFSSLHEATSNLPLVEPVGEVPVIGYDTASAIRSGVVGGMVSEIADVFSFVANEYGCSGVIVTGSDALILLPLLEARGLPVVSEPDLVGRGLLSILRYNLSMGE